MGKPLEQPAPADAVLRTCGQDSHLFQLYSTDSSVLAKNVARYLVDGFNAGTGGLVVAAPEHSKLFLAELAGLGVDTQAVLDDHRLQMIDAREMLERLLLDGYPDANRFEAYVGGAVHGALADRTGLRVYGEMVGILWERRQYPAAIRLEQLWNRLRRTTSFDLFCAYPIDIFGKQFDHSTMGALLGAHTHLLPSGFDAELVQAVDRAMHDVLGLHPVPLAAASETWRNSSLPSGEAAILWLRKHHPEKADDIVARAQHYYQASA